MLQNNYSGNNLNNIENGIGMKTINGRTMSLLSLNSDNLRDNKSIGSLEDPTSNNNLLRDIETLIENMEQNQAKQNENMLKNIETLLGTLLSKQEQSRASSATSNFSHIITDRLNMKSPIPVQRNNSDSLVQDDDIKSFVNQHIRDIDPGVSNQLENELTAEVINHQLINNGNFDETLQGIFDDIQNEFNEENRNNFGAADNNVESTGVQLPQANGAAKDNQLESEDEDDEEEDDSDLDEQKDNETNIKDTIIDPSQNVLSTQEAQNLLPEENVAIPRQSNIDVPQEAAVQIENVKAVEPERLEAVSNASDSLEQTASTSNIPQNIVTESISSSESIETPITLVSNVKVNQSVPPAVVEEEPRTETASTSINTLAQSKKMKKLIKQSQKKMKKREKPNNPFRTKKLNRKSSEVQNTETVNIISTPPVITAVTEPALTRNFHEREAKPLPVTTEPSASVSPPMNQIEESNSIPETHAEVTSEVDVQVVNVSNNPDAQNEIPTAQALVQEAMSTPSTSGTSPAAGKSPKPQNKTARRPSKIPIKKTYSNSSTNSLQSPETETTGNAGTSEFNFAIQNAEEQVEDMQLEESGIIISQKNSISEDDSNSISAHFEGIDRNTNNTYEDIAAQLENVKLEIAQAQAANILLLEKHAQNLDVVPSDVLPEPAVSNMPSEELVTPDSVEQPNLSQVNPDNNEVPENATNNAAVDSMIPEENYNLMNSHSMPAVIETQRQSQNLSELVSDTQRLIQQMKDEINSDIADTYDDEDDYSSDYEDVTEDWSGEDLDEEEDEEEDTYEGGNYKENGINSNYEYEDDDDDDDYLETENEEFSRSTEDYESDHTDALENLTIPDLEEDGIQTQTNGDIIDNEEVPMAGADISPIIASEESQSNSVPSIEITSDATTAPMAEAENPEQPQLDLSVSGTQLTEALPVPENSIDATADDLSVSDISTSTSSSIGSISSITGLQNQLSANHPEDSEIYFMDAAEVTTETNIPATDQSDQNITPVDETLVLATTELPNIISNISSTTEPESTINQTSNAEDVNSAAAGNATLIEGSMAQSQAILLPAPSEESNVIRENITNENSVSPVEKLESPSPILIDENENARRDVRVVSPVETQLESRIETLSHFVEQNLKDDIQSSAPSSSEHRIVDSGFDIFERTAEQPSTSSGTPKTVNNKILAKKIITKALSSTINAASSSSASPSSTKPKPLAQPEPKIEPKRKVSLGNMSKVPAEPKRKTSLENTPSRKNSLKKKVIPTGPFGTIQTNNVKSIQKELMNKTTKDAPNSATSSKTTSRGALNKIPSKLTPPKILSKQTVSSFANKLTKLITPSSLQSSSKADKIKVDHKIPKKKYMETCFSDDYQTTDDEDERVKHQNSSERPIIKNLLKTLDFIDDEPPEVSI